MTENVSSLHLQKVLDFISEIGITIIEKELVATTFLPGLTLGNNCIYVDFDKLLYPGDLLHEAGHLAVAGSEIRNQIELNTLQNWPTDGEEIAAILWSFAAAKHINFPIESVFHPFGYKNQSKWLIDNFEKKNYIGLPLLEWMGLTLSQEKAILENKEAFPIMQKWMRD